MSIVKKIKVIWAGWGWADYRHADRKFREEREEARRLERELRDSEDPLKDLERKEIGGW